MGCDLRRCPRTPSELRKLLPVFVIISQRYSPSGALAACRPIQDPSAFPALMVPASLLILGALGCCAVSCAVRPFRTDGCASAAGCSTPGVKPETLAFGKENYARSDRASGCSESLRCSDSAKASTARAKASLHRCA